MDKNSQSSGGDNPVTTTTSAGGGTSNNNNSSGNSANNHSMYLKHLNKISHKISKPVRKPTAFDHHNRNQIQAPPPTAPPPPVQPQSQPSGLQQQHQPPVYNINKSDFRDVVQKLTGSPAHERFSTPPPIQPPKPQSSRLQRIRPPPLAQISNRPPPMLGCAPPPSAHATNLMRPPLTSGPPAVQSVGVGGGGSIGNQKMHQPLSPLPPFPSVHAAAESPISAYMRFLQGGGGPSSSGLSPLAPLVSPRWHNISGPPPPLQNNQNGPPPPSQLPDNQNIPPPPPPPVPSFPTSPLPFGCLPSPRSPYGMFSPSLMFAPQLPLSPTLPVPSPRWKGI